MADKGVYIPPANTGRLNRNRVVEKPKNMRGTLRRLWDFTKGSRRGLAWILLLSALTSASASLSPLLIGRIITAINGGDPAALLLLTLLGVYVCDWLVHFLQQFFMASIGQKIIYAIRTALFGAMKRLPLSFFDSHQHGELMSRLTNDIDNISTTLSNSLTMLLTNCFTVLGIFGIMLSLSRVLTAISLVSVALAFLLTRVITRRTKKMFSEQQKVLGKLNGQVEESISGLAMVKAFCREDEEEREFAQNSEQLCAVATRALTWSGFLMPITNIINNLSYVSISVASGVMAVQGLVTIGMISSFLLYVRQFTRPFVDIANIYNNFQTAVAGAERVFEIMDARPEPPDRPGALPLPAPKGDIELRHVDFGYNEEQKVLRDVSLRIPAGTRVAIVGPTGSGKTTIISLLTRFYDVTGGQILLDGHDLRDYRLEDLRRAYGVVLQDTALFAESVRDNIRYGKQDASPAQVEAAAHMAGADLFISRLPQRYDTVLTQGGAELSQGERQLLTIARAILTDAPILILDEATSSVDTLTEQLIRRAMLRVTAGRTSIIIAHRLSTTRDSDRVVLLENGEITETGTHEQLMAANGHYAALYRTQTGMGGGENDEGEDQ